ncbi:MULTISPECIES: PTS glucitol/sorbitol transporter subunit IIC [Cryobacterium]|uniref:PTS glucitol/sorbitol transporter subunit IIC n=1 Tax=Cryobacterium glucosi TaxID=1259175 RepID=A0ABY2IP02_9MICO|nr:MULTISPECIES: PTS glucitol/sorbitol transporter subunit IIC [Cryobacterium]TFB95307.1 PTS glucitol/sorbitol transporter subunit IIC [Cryobacterium sp. MDB2-A-1]TFC11342.1 PTS glucitol/sorbitol transporter subunit IIC [Cryobacterium sp. MDB2-A-2]TFC11639.1 PTS glucitol/sorbitol transporter subunit IIC [Cryobacterium sp. MDB2-33-2]TFC18890.1 PTS glucitol/sorbitol transporter subunit IIC [Cryobacterium sp. MDB2-10]TFC21639.1 PTS glucitol/sorbitol transporter subunit IIC [Cryobacterium glucosi]
MDILGFLVQGAQLFIGLFQTGADTFISWMQTIVPVVLLLLIAMNSLIRLIGEDRVNRFASKAGGNPLMRYMVLPFVGSFLLANPMVHSLGRFMPERYKPSYFASAAFFCHTSNGIFPHINPGELFIWLGVAAGVQKLGLDAGPLAIRYLLVGLVLNFLSGWVTDLTTTIVMKQQGVTLSKTVRMQDAAMAMG